MNTSAQLNTSRRVFLSTLSAATASVVAGSSLSAPVAAAEVAADVKAKDASIIDSPPVLQNPSPTGMTVAWAVRGPATGWVEYGDTPELGQRADATQNGLNPLADRFLSVRLEGLPEGKTTYYRVVSVPVNFKYAYSIERGEPVRSEIFEFLPPTAKRDTASFAVINDTHEKESTLEALMQQLAAEPADFTVWNGDMFDDIRSDDQIVAQALRPANSPYAANRPVLFTSGNHDVRGVHARSLNQAMTDWPGQGKLGRCFAVRQGPLALIGLDTGEDKPDRHPVFAGLANFEPYREAQGVWLAETLARPEIASAPFIVVFCHIPLWGLEGHNPGDTLEGYAYYSRQSQKAWHPALEKANIQLVICGHMHDFRYDTPNDVRKYGQLVGGGPHFKDATLIRGSATAETLEISAHKLDKTLLGRWKFEPRRG